MSFGVFSAGVSLGLQITSHESVDDLPGESFSLGGSVGTVPTAGVDLITDPDRESIENDEVKGVKFSIGFGYGFDVHIKRTTTKKVVW